MKVMISGGAGYIGSTIASALLDQGGIPIVLDSLVTGSRDSVGSKIFYHGDISDDLLIDQIFQDHPDIAVVIHCAALIDVNESVVKPMEYYRNNVVKSLHFIESLIKNGVKRIIFSSSAAMYRADGSIITESADISPATPYGWTKAMSEQMFADIARSSDTRFVSFRYFNPIGADPLMRSGPRASGSTHVLGKIMNASAEGIPFTITGTDYPTHDGTGLRDYLHVWDLARAHVRAAQVFDQIVDATNPYLAINLGRGVPVSVRELVETFNKVSPIQVEVREGQRRPGDVTGGFASCELARYLLEWRTTLSIDEAIRDSLAWVSRQQSQTTAIANFDC